MDNYGGNFSVGVGGLTTLSRHRAGAAAVVLVPGAGAAVGAGGVLGWKVHHEREEEEDKEQEEQEEKEYE